jgi:peptide/nickel transport system substrate-binding protein
MSVMKITARRLVATTSVAALAASVLLVGGINTANAATAKPVTGGTLYYYTHNEQFPNLDPTRIYTGRDIAFFGSYTTRTLVSYNPVAGPDGASLIPDMATNTGVPSNKAKTWTYTLRPGISWEDGKPVTCADVKYGWSRAFATEVYVEGPTYAIAWLDIPKASDGSSAYKGPYKKTGQALFDKAVTCSKDNRTITFNLARTVPDFNYFMTYPAAGPVPQAKDTGDKYDLHPVSNGPYMIKKYAINDEMVLVRNPNWKKSSDPFRTPYPDDIVVKFGMDEDVRDQIDMEDQIPNGINMDNLQPANVTAFFADPKNKNRRMNNYDPYTSFLAANNSAGHLDCLDVRKAVFFAYDNQSLINLSGGLVYYGEMGDNPVKPVIGIDYAKTTGNIHDANFKIDGNPDYAKTILEKAKTSCPDAYDRATNPDKGLVYYRADTATNKKAAVLVESALQKAGIVIKTVYKPAGTYNANLETYKNETDFLSSGWGADWANASTVIPELWGEGCCNYTKNKKTPEYAGFIKKVNLALVELDRKKQAKMWQELSQYGMDQYWYIRTVFGKSQQTWGSKIGGVYYWYPQGSFGFGQLYVKQ